MDGPLKELSKLEKLTANTGTRGKTPSIADSLDSLLEVLERTKQQVASDGASKETWKFSIDTLDSKKKEIDEKQKEIYSSMSRLGKALDKKFTSPLPSYPDLFASSTAVDALERTIALHFLRTGQFDTAETFLEEGVFDYGTGGP
uniref:LisH domain-containing protein n=1 Tax=Moniliophthora roreri TaxID=221103 RepID=A0A0W0F9A1_MONRR